MFSLKCICIDRNFPVADITLSEAHIGLRGTNRV